jgi:hypothetical protein
MTEGSTTTGNVQGLIERLNDEACSREGWPDDLIAEAATALSELVKRVEVLEEAIRKMPITAAEVGIVAACDAALKSGG